MAKDVLIESLPFLLMMGYLLVSCVLRVISGYLRNTIDIHVTVRESKLMRINYAKESADRGGHGEEVNVDIVEDEEDGEDAVAGTIDGEQEVGRAA